MSKLVPVPRRLVVVALFLNVLLALACGPVRLVSPYDEVLDQGTTSLHSDVAGFVGKMVLLSGKPEGTYEANKNAYPEFNAEVASLRLRATSVEKNEITVELFDLLAGNLERLRALHESGREQGLSKPLAGPALAALDTNFQSIMKFEIAKRRGEAD